MIARAASLSDIFGMNFLFGSSIFTFLRNGSIGKEEKGRSRSNSAGFAITMGKNHIRVSRLRRGVSLVETLTVALITVMVVGTIFAVVLQSGRVAKKVDAQTESGRRAQIGLEVLNNDLQRSAGAIVTYPTATGEFSSDNDSTLILQLPVFDDNGVRDTSKYEVVVYTLEVPDGEDRGSLVRYTATVEGGVEGDLERDRRIVPNVDELSFVYKATESFLGYDSQTMFGLRSTPDQSMVRPKILIGSKDWNDDKWGMVTGGSVRFTRPPRSGVPIDVVYGINPATSSGASGLNAASIVHANVRADRKVLLAKGGYHWVPTEYSVAGEMKNR
jgi:hypothetical protein